LLKHEPSAQRPWQNTILGLVCIDFAVIASSPLIAAATEGHRSC
jgi:hypothetical protein